MSGSCKSVAERPLHLSRLLAKKETLIMRNRVLEAVRRFFEKDGFMEVETPCRVPAVAPERHIDALVSEGWYLQTSPELCMKQMLCAGYDRIFQICRCFRKGERGRIHLPEFTLLEWYASGWDHFRLMAHTEALLKYAAAGQHKGGTLSYQGHTVDLRKPWPRMTVAEAFDRFAPIPLNRALAEARFEEVLALEVEAHLGFDAPVFLYGYPASRGSLARLDPEDPSVASRFELFICGIELCNGFHELTDPVEQRRRFEKERTAQQRAGKTMSPMPETFLNTMPWMPDCAGNALGLDRLVMLLGDVPTIDSVVAFPPESL